ncbi:unnamed protein product [Cuscuta campestris]|uniref:RING-type E3 ubiquitin transferase n=1 Tax=Cuscuta campestris TaxID=132261 RepID=A0A484MKH4_9ASTE|nr:unnamed protein product [Cuscuta campestris]
MENQISKSPKFHLTIVKFPVHLLLILVLTLSGAAAGSPKLPSPILYSEHCGDVVPESPVSPDATPVADPRSWLALRNAYFSGGDLGALSTPGSSLSLSVLHFTTRNVHRTVTDGVYKLEGSVYIPRSYGQRVPAGLTRRRGLRFVNYRPPRFPRPGYPPVINLSGFWSSITGQLCMVGSGFSKANYAQYALKLSYLNSSTIFDSLVNGSLERFGLKHNERDHNKSLEISGFSLRNYNYSLIDKEVEKDTFNAYDGFVNHSLGLSSNQYLCSALGNAIVELEYPTECNGANCDLIDGISSKFTPYDMYFKEIECSKESGRTRYLLFFRKQRRTDFEIPFDQNATLVTEGKWNQKKKRLEMVVCRVLKDSDVSSSKHLIGDCTIRLSLRMPSRWTLRERSDFVGNIWSTAKNSNESGYFPNMTFRSNANRQVRPAGVVYEYTEIERAKRSCANKMISKVKGKEGKYPEPHSSNMRFNTILRSKTGVESWAYSSPLSVGENFFNIEKVHLGTYGNLSRVVNISFVFHFSFQRDFMFGGNHSNHPYSMEISSEGLYDSKTGHLCMIGCMHVVSQDTSLLNTKYTDCEVQVDIQYAPLNAKSGKSVIKGTIESLRVKSDHFYFQPLEIVSTSLYIEQARESIWRMDLEITLVLVSNTLMCLFVGLQLLYVKNHPHVLPFISITMMVLLTVAHMIPLLLNFEALFLANRNKQNVYLGGDVWLEVNEVLVRVITMVAFLLEFRLLQLTWSSRKTGVESQHMSLWTADKKVLLLSLPLYGIGGLVALCVHALRARHQRRAALLHRFHRLLKKWTLWGGLKSYAGFILDGFLLPQILFNVFSITNEKALSPTFFLGNTLVRLLPHVYDLYRAHHGSTWTLSYIYADPKLDYYSTSWDIIICCVGILFASLIYLQQRFGGRCFLPSRFRETAVVYEKAPTAVSAASDGS